MLGSQHPSPNVGPATTQNLVVKFDGEICGGVLVDSASDDFPQQKKLENLLPNFAGSSPPIPPKTSPTSLWKSLVLTNVKNPLQLLTAYLTRKHHIYHSYDFCSSKVAKESSAFLLKL